MKRTYLIAGAIAVAVVAWLATGLLVRDDPTATTKNNTPAEATSGVEAAPAVQVRTIEATPHERRLTLFGRTEVGRAVKVRAETIGRVIEQVVRKGQWVDAGDVIARLSMDDREATLREAEAMVVQWEKKFEATQKLSQSGFQSDVRKAEDWAALQGARARLAAAKLDIERTQIRAPFRGVVDEFPAEVGDFLDRHDPIATVADMDPIKLVADVPERDIGGIKEGSQADIRLITGRELQGTVRFVARMGFSSTRTFRVEIIANNPDGAIGQGITAKVSLPLGTELAHRVSPSILTLDDSGKVGVKIIDDDKHVSFKPVRIIDDTPEGMWLAGLPQRATIITVGQEFVRDGQRVRPVPALAAAAGVGDPS